MTAEGGRRLTVNGRLRSDGGDAMRSAPKTAWAESRKDAVSISILMAAVPVGFGWAIITDVKKWSLGARMALISEQACTLNG